MKKLFLVVLSLISIMSVTSCSFIINQSNTNSSNSSLTPSQKVEDDSKKEVVNITTTPNDSTHSPLVDVIEEVRPSVVDINAYSVSFSSAGSGVIVGKSDEAYYVITNHHVIDQATNFEVVVYKTEDDSKKYEASLIGTSMENDIAALKISTTDELTTVSFIEDSSKVKVGTEVIAIGNPLGILGGSVTHGIVSAMQREVYLSELGYMDLIQTDAAINSGNSGGALFNNQGLLVGIVNSGYSDYQGLNFAIPSNVAKASFTSIINTYKNDGNNYGYFEGETNIGMSLNVATVYNNINSNQQIDVVYVSSVNANSDASKNGILDYLSYQNGRTNCFYAIEKVNGVSITSLEETVKTLENIRAGEQLTLTCRKIQASRSFMSAQYYLTGESFEVSFVTSQYIYSMPN